MERARFDRTLSIGAAFERGALCFHSAMGETTSFRCRHLRHLYVISLNAFNHKNKWTLAHRTLSAISAVGTWIVILHIVTYVVDFYTGSFFVTRDHFIHKLGRPTDPSGYMSSIKDYNNVINMSTVDAIIAA